MAGLAIAGQGVRRPCRVVMSMTLTEAPAEFMTMASGGASAAKARVASKGQRQAKGGATGDHVAGLVAPVAVAKTALAQEENTAGCCDQRIVGRGMHREGEEDEAHEPARLRRQGSAAACHPEPEGEQQAAKAEHPAFRADAQIFVMRGIGADKRGER